MNFLFLVWVYVMLDLGLSFTLGRCVLPGLKCAACREAARRDAK